jgi:hypothetical protein
MAEAATTVIVATMAVAEVAMAAVVAGVDAKI